MLEKAFIPYRGYYSSPFARWQGSFANENSIALGAETAKRWIAAKSWDPKIFDYVILGITIGQPHSFYGSPWAAALLGAEGTPGMSVSQACTTSTTGIFQASAGVETGLYNNALCLMTDRCSNGPHTIWPNPMGPGGQVNSENWVMDNFGSDPWGKESMVKTAENVAKEAGFTRQQADEVTLRRYHQYLMAFENDREFFKRYMFPVEVKVSKKKSLLVDADEGVIETTREGLADLRPVLPGGIHTYGSQTHPADGNCAVVVTSGDNAKRLSADPSIEIQVVSYGFARAKKAFMGMAPVPAARMALQKAGISIKEIKAVKTHNPFVVNDLYMAREMGIDVMKMNNYGCSLIFGHPQAPTGGRGIIEGIEEVVKLGGGYLLWGGCAAGDTGAGIVLKIG